MAAITGLRLRAAVLMGAAWSLGFFAVAGCEDDTTHPGDTTPPQAPAELSVTGVTRSSVTIRWIAPGDDQGSGRAALYDIRYSSLAPQGDSWWDSSTVTVPDPPLPRSAGEAESLTVRGLLADTPYYLAMRAADEASNWSALSEIVMARTASLPDTISPAPIVDLTVESISDSSVTLGWTATGDDGAQGIANRYDLRYAQEELSEESWESAAVAEGTPAPGPPGTIERFEVTGLLPSHEYWFAIRVVDESGNRSPISNLASASPDDTPPQPVGDLRAVETTGGSVTLEWTAPETPGQPGDPAIYDLRYALEPVTERSWDSAAGAVGLPSPGEPGSTERFEVVGLAADTLYFFAVKTGDRVPNWASISNVALGATQESAGRILRVAPDGAGEYPTLLAAVAAAESGDIIELEDGVYEGEGNRGIRYFGKAITVRSRSGNPRACIIDCGSAGRAFRFDAGEGEASLVQGVTIRNGLAGGSNGRGGAVLCSGLVSPTIYDCVFESNRAADMGGAIYSQLSARPRILHCRFEGNSSQTLGGAIVDMGGPFTAKDCLFLHNEAAQGGAINIYTVSRVKDCRFHENLAVGADGYASAGGALAVSGDAQIEGCIFDANQALSGGAILIAFGWPTITNCTFAYNQADQGGALELYYGLLTVERVIIANDLSAAPVAISDYLPTFVCSNMYGNLAGDWTGEFAGQAHFQGNFSADPRFCDPEGGDFRIHPDSPCAPGASGCGWVGGGAVGCDRADRSRPWLRLIR